MALESGAFYSSGRHSAGSGLPCDVESEWIVSVDGSGLLVQCCMRRTGDGALFRREARERTWSVEDAVVPSTSDGVPPHRLVPVLALGGGRTCLLRASRCDHPRRERRRALGSVRGLKRETPRVAGVRARGPKPQAVRGLETRLQRGDWSLDRPRGASWIKSFRHQTRDETR